MKLEWPKQTSENRPWTRWWWLGSAVNKETLTNLLEEYHRIGLGGVEITPIYGVRGQENSNLSFLSPEWLEMLRYTIGEADRLQMQVDLPPGSGWRIGGDFLAEELRAAQLDVSARLLEQGETVDNNFAGTLLAAVAANPQGERVDLTAPLLSGQNWTAPAPGWTLHLATSQVSGEQVKRPGPGGAGPTFNPFDRASLNAVTDYFTPFLGDLGLRAQFHDSWEYTSDSCPGFAKEFQKRRGYRMADYLEHYGEDTETARRLRHDLRQTLGEMALENFIAPWHEWCHSLGQLSRNQAHGSPANILDLYAAVDIPETEVFRAPTPDTPLISKFASSAAHVAGRQLASSETCTWQGEHFNVSLSDARALIDGLFVSGINHIVYHGTAYSPQEAAWPGWLFYASSQFNPQNPMWHDFGTLNHYIARVQSILQANAPSNDILLYFPCSDIDTDVDGNLAVLKSIGASWLDKHPFLDCARTLWQKGYAVDYVSDLQLTTVETVNGWISAPGGSYRLIVVPPCSYMPLTTLERLYYLADSGAEILFVDQLPEDVPGLGNLQKDRDRMSTLLKTLDWQNATAAIGRGSWLRGPIASLEQHHPELREHMCDHGLHYIRRQRQDGCDYFVLNPTDSAFDGDISLTHGTDYVAICDPMTGAIGLADQTGNAVRLQLPPGVSLILRCYDKGVDAKPWQYLDPSGPVQELSGTWNVSCLEGGPQAFAPFQPTTPCPWTERGDENADRFAGTVRYSLRFERPAQATSYLLDLGTVHESARVILNGKELGTLIGPSYRLRIDELQDENLLEVDVTSLAANRIRDMDRRGIDWRIFEDINFVNLDYEPFDASEWPIRPSGLRGPVTLTPLRNWATSVSC